MICSQKPYTDLWYNDIGQGLGVHVQLLSQVKLQRVLVVLKVVLDAVVDVRDFRDVERLVLRAEVLLYLAPAPTHQFPGFAVV